MINISELYIYPVKSLAGIKLTASKLSPFGLQYDRRWMIVDSQGQFLSQREMANMACIKTNIINDQLVLTYDDSEIVVPTVDTQSNSIQVTVWDDSFKASHVSKDVDNWLTLILGKECQLVFMQEDVQRQIDL